MQLILKLISCHCHQCRPAVYDLCRRKCSIIFFSGEMLDIFELKIPWQPQQSMHAGQVFQTVLEQYQVQATSTSIIVFERNLIRKHIYINT